MEIQLLGGVTATDGGQSLDLGPAKCQALLAALALSAGEAVPVSHLVDVIWGDDPPRTAEKTLQGYVVRLRKGLGSDAIVRSGSAYRLAVPPECVDVVRFRTLLKAGDVSGALAAWTGRPLAGLDVPGLAAVGDGLVEQWLDAMEDDLGDRVVSDTNQAVVTLTELTAAHPFREELWALLMVALYRLGRQAEALAAFQRARHHLVSELGVEPGPRLRSVEASILDHDAGLREDLPAAGPSQPPEPRRPTGTVTFGFVEVADATRLWVEHRRKMALAVSRLDELLREVTAFHDGTVISASGESSGVAFHRADDAAAWAAALQVAVEQEPWPGGVELRLQVGLHTGEPEEHDNGYFGTAVHTAARLAGCGHGGQILVSDVTAGLLERDDLRDLGTHRLEGVVGDLAVRQLGGGLHPPLRTASSRRGNLPRRTRRLVGRERDLEMVAQALETSAVVTLIGPGGIGKTTLALASAGRAEVDDPRRVWLIELADVSSPDDVVQAVAEILGVTGGEGRTLADSIVASLRARPSLLVLDNCEHVIEAAAALAQAIADDGADVRVLATSREGLGIPSERRLSLGPLDATGPAVELFAERAEAAAGSFDLDAVRDDVVEICRRLDGLPLAIELAAARLTSLSVRQVLERLDDRLRLLGGGRRAGAERHSTLRTTVQWSYDLLSRPQQALFERLAVFAGPFDLAAVEAVADPTVHDAIDVDHLLGDLVERSMVSVESSPFGRRFRLLETLRQFAQERLRATDDWDPVAARHARWCRDEVARIGAMLTGHREIEGVDRLNELWPNLRAAVDWAISTGAVTLADALVRPIVTEIDLRRRAEIGVWAERILDLHPPADEAGVLFWMLWAGHRHVQAGNEAAYRALMLRHGHADHPVNRFNAAYLSGVGEDMQASGPAAVDWLRGLGEPHAADVVRVSGVASALMTLQRFAELDVVAASMAEQHRAHGPATLAYFALGLQGYAAQYQGRVDEAAQFFTQAIATPLPAGTYRIIQTVEARMAFEQEDRLRAYRILHENIEDLLDSDYTDVTRMVAVEFISMAAAAGRLDEVPGVLTYLDSTGDFGRLARDSLVAEAVRQVESDPDPVDGGGVVGAHDALVLMRHGLTQLAQAG